MEKKKPVLRQRTVVAPEGIEVQGSSGAGNNRTLPHRMYKKVMAGRQPVLKIEEGKECERHGREAWEWDRQVRKWLNANIKITSGENVAPSAEH